VTVANTSLTSMSVTPARDDHVQLALSGRSCPGLCLNPTISLDTGSNLELRLRSHSHGSLTCPPPPGETQHVSPAEKRTEIGAVRYVVPRAAFASSLLRTVIVGSMLRMRSKGRAPLVLLMNKPRRLGWMFVDTGSQGGISDLYPQEDLTCQALLQLLF
jgi:hypothetical protein